VKLNTSVKLFDLLLGGTESIEGFRTALEVLGFQMCCGRMPETNKLSEIIAELREEVEAQLKAQAC